jgi:hemerythrin
MVHIQWKDRYSINYKDIDDQHKVLVGILNQLIDMLDQEASADQVVEIVHQLCQYALTHFTNEERYMEAVGYPGLERQKAQHAAFINRLLELNRTYDATDGGLVEETLEFVKKWFLNHIMESDQDYVPYMKAFHAKAEIKGLIFSFNEVIGHIDWPQLAAILAAQHGKTPEELQALADERSTLNQLFARGQLDAIGYLAQASEACGCEFKHEDFWKPYADICTPIETTFELIRQLIPDYQIALMADISPWHFEHVVRNLDIFPLFDAVTLSYELGVVRPDKALWNDALSKLNLMAEECAYIDARGSFALAASGHLLHGLAYTNHEALLTGLRRMKVKI